MFILPNYILNKINLMVLAVMYFSIYTEQFDSITLENIKCDLHDSILNHFIENGDFPPVSNIIITQTGD